MSGWISRQPPVQTPTPTTISLLVLLLLLTWRIYSRFKRLVERQHLSSVRPWITVTLFPVLIALLALSAWRDPNRLGLLGAGVAGGVALGVFGLSKTKFECTPQGLFYTPNTHLGIALSLLIVVRLAFRLITVLTLNPGEPPMSDNFTRSPLTLAIVGLLAGYYTTYAIGLLRWRAQEALPQASHQPGTATETDADV